MQCANDRRFSKGDRESESKNLNGGGTLPRITIKKGERGVCVCVCVCVCGEAYLLWRGGPAALIGSPTGERK